MWYRIHYRSHVYITIKELVNKNTRGKRGCGGKGREMTQTLYAHMNKRKKKKTRKLAGYWKTFK
jgi:hypothetical protein